MMTRPTVLVLLALALLAAAQVTAQVQVSPIRLRRDPAAPARPATTTLQLTPAFRARAGAEVRAWRTRPAHPARTAHALLRPRHGMRR